METSFDILVVILSTFLALFLLGAIVAVVKIIQLINHLRAIVEKAELFAEKAERVSDYVSRAAGPVAIGRLLTNIFDHVFKKESKNKEDK